MSNKSYIKIFLLVLLLAICLVAGFVVVKKTKAPVGGTSIINNQSATNSSDQVNTGNQPIATNSQATQNNTSTIDPIPNVLARITKKPFGIYITPKTSPVQPERFQGYHTGTDLETYTSEQNVDVAVKALCDGKLLEARYASGYGGVAVESCNLNGQAVTIIYGHIRLSSVAFKIGDQLKAGDFLANLGTGYSSETDGERKHLHLGIHIGPSINILGYVQNKSELGGWLNAEQFLN
jgi:hypothetical protein